MGYLLVICDFSFGIFGEVFLSIAWWVFTLPTCEPIWKVQDICPRKLMEIQIRPLIGDELMCLFPGWNSPTFQYLLPFLLIPSLSSSPLHSQSLMLVAHLEVCDICLRSILDSIDVVHYVWLGIFFHMWNQCQILRSFIC